LDSLLPSILGFLPALWLCGTAFSFGAALQNLSEKDTNKTGDADLDPAYEVRRIIRAKVSVDFLAEFKERLQKL